VGQAPLDTVMKSVALVFQEPHRVALQEEEVVPPDRDEVLVEAHLSAISPGTEMLVFKGEFPPHMPLDETIESLAANVFEYPLHYGYSVVGQVTAVGDAVNRHWIGRRVFAFHPHASHFTVKTENLVAIPEGIPVEDALFLAAMETALNLVMDGRPMIGERVVVLGQGIVGLLTTALLARFPLENLITVDPYPLRRQTSLSMGARQSLAPDEGEPSPRQSEGSPHLSNGSADLVYELSGNPAALNVAIQVAHFSGRIVIGSWYGTKRAAVDLGSWFHRSRLRILSSQVSTIDPQFSGCWTKNRRFQAAWDLIQKVRPAQLITHRFPIQAAPEAYALIAQHSQQTIQVILTY
jgi:2-desacetyl-2-hydroxyethyl bacteriochlorophyllide A dehydrogenase